MILKGQVLNNIPLWVLKTERDISRSTSKILGAEFHAPDLWFFPAYHPFGKQVLEEICFTFPTVEKDKSVEQFQKYFNKCSDVLENNKIKSDFTFKTTPMQHQLEGLVRAIIYFRLGVFWECGVGKTKLAVDTVRYLKLNTLYICPSRLVENTKEEFDTHSFEGEIEVVPIVGKWSKAKKLEEIRSRIGVKTEKPTVYIIGYETLIQKLDVTKEGAKSYADLLNQLDYSMIFLDEAHKLRDVSSSTSTYVSLLARKAYRRIIMTGTPSLGNPLHLFAQLRLLLPWRYKNYFSFKNTYVKVSPYNKNIIIGFKNLSIINKQVNQFCIQKTKEECLDLPDRQVVIKNITMSEEQATLYEEVKKGLHESVAYNPIAILVQNKLHQVCGGTLVESPIDSKVCDNCDSIPFCVEQKVTPFSKRCVRRNVDRPVKKHILTNNPKLDYLKGMLNDLVMEEEKKVILWYRYQLEYDIITEMMTQQKIPFVDYANLGHEAVQQFQDKSLDKGGLVFLSQIQSSSGITLTEASYTIYYSLTFDLEHYLQSRDRMYRKGQTKKTTEFHLVMQNSIDSHISMALQKKMDVNQYLLNISLVSQVPRFIKNN